MTHVKLTGDIGRGDYDGVRGSFGIGVGGKVTLFAPIPVNLVLKAFGIIIFFQQFCHNKPQLFFFFDWLKVNQFILLYFVEKCKCFSDINGNLNTDI
jgi:hypothetical protein